MEAVMSSSNSNDNTDNVTSISERKPVTSAQIAAKRLAEKAASKKGTVKLSAKPKAKAAQVAKKAKPAKAAAPKAAKKERPGTTARKAQTVANTKRKAAVKAKVASKAKPVTKVKAVATRNKSAAAAKVEIKKVSVSLPDWKAKLLAQIPDDLHATQQLSLFVNVGIYASYKVQAERKGVAQVALFRDAITYYAAKGFPVVKVDE